MRLPKCTAISTSCGMGGDVGPRGSAAWKIRLAEAGRSGVPPLAQALVKAVACEAVHHPDGPLRRLSTADIAAQARQALGQRTSPSTVWRLLEADAIQPWQSTSWMFLRDPPLADKAGRVLDWDAGDWHGEPRGPQDHRISAEEKTRIQARIRRHPRLPSASGRTMRIAHESERGGARPSWAGWEVRCGFVMGRDELSTGIEPFGRLVTPVMERAPYCAAARVCWVVENGSSHRGQATVRRWAKA